MSDSLKIIFAGTPDFSVPPLQALLDAGHRVVAVYTQPDRPAGRGRKLLASPVKQLAESRQIPLFQPRNFKDETDRERLAGLAADLMVVVAYGLILPQPVLDAPRLGCINIHASLLPRWRGAAPIQRALLAGDTHTGVTIMQMEAGLDTGPMLLTQQTPVAADESGGMLHDRLAQIGAEALLQALPGIADGSLHAEPQDDAAACYAKKLEKAEAAIDWSQPADLLGRQVRAFNPWPVAQTTLRGEVLRVWVAWSDPQPNDAMPGSVISATAAGIQVATGSGSLYIKRLQQPGKRAMSAGDFLNAHQLDGVVLGRN